MGDEKLIVESNCMTVALYDKECLVCNFLS